MLSCGALGRILAACALGMVTVVYGGVLWSPGIAFCEKVKNVIFRHLKFVFHTFALCCVDELLVVMQ